MLFHGKFNPMPTVFHGGGHDRLVQVHDRGSKSQGNKQLYVVDCVEAWMLLHRQGMSFSTRVCPVCDCCVLGSRIPAAQPANNTILFTTDFSNVRPHQQMILF